MKENYYNKKRYITFKEFVFTVDAIEKDDDEEEYNVYYREFDDFDKAVKKYLELREKGWEIVSISIRPKDKNDKIKFEFIKNEEETFVHVTINEEVINKKVIEKFERIKKILEE